MKLASYLLLPILPLLLFSCESTNKTATIESVSVSVSPSPAPTEIPEEEILEKTFLALGDSYTIGESVPEEDRWPVQLVGLLNAAGVHFAKPEIIARTGWTTDELIQAIQNADPRPPYDLVSLLIGVNNQYRGYAQNVYRQEFTELLQTAIQFAGGNPHYVIVLNIPDWGATPFASRDPRGPEHIAAEIQEFNRINREEALRVGVHYIDIFNISQEAYTDPALIARDLLHPSGTQYTRWAEAALPVVLEIFK